MRQTELLKRNHKVAALRLFSLVTVSCLCSLVFSHVTYEFEGDFDANGITLDIDNTANLCLCDLTSRGCDLNCQCDPDCPSNIESFRADYGFDFVGSSVDITSRCYSTDNVKLFKVNSKPSMLSTSEAAPGFVCIDASSPTQTGEKVIQFVREIKSHPFVLKYPCEFTELSTDDADNEKMENASTTVMTEKSKDGGKKDDLSENGGAHFPGDKKKSDTASKTNKSEASKQAEKKKFEETYTFTKDSEDASKKFSTVRSVDNVNYNAHKFNQDLTRSTQISKQVGKVGGTTSTKAKAGGPIDSKLASEVTSFSDYKKQMAATSGNPTLTPGMVPSMKKAKTPSTSESTTTMKVPLTSVPAKKEVPNSPTAKDHVSGIGSGSSNLNKYTASAGTKGVVAKDIGSSGVRKNTTTGIMSKPGTSKVAAKPVPNHEPHHDAGASDEYEGEGEGSKPPAPSMSIKMFGGHLIQCLLICVTASCNRILPIYPILRASLLIASL